MDCLEQLSTDLADIAPELSAPSASLLSDTLQVMGYELELSRNSAATVEQQRSQIKQELDALAAAQSAPCRNLAGSFHFAPASASIDIEQGWLFFARLALDTVRPLGDSDLTACCCVLAYASTYSPRSLDHVVAAWLETYVLQHIRQPSTEKVLRNVLVRMLVHRCTSLSTVVTRFFTPLIERASVFDSSAGLSQLRTLAEILSDTRSDDDGMSSIADRPVSTSSRVERTALAARRVVLSTDTESRAGLLHLVEQVVNCQANWNDADLSALATVRDQIFGSETLLRSFRASPQFWLANLPKHTGLQAHRLLTLDCMTCVLSSARASKLSTSVPVLCADQWCPGLDEEASGAVDAIAWRHDESCIALHRYLALVEGSPACANRDARAEAPALTAFFTGIESLTRDLGDTLTMQATEEVGVASPILSKAEAYVDHGQPACLWMRHSGSSFWPAIGHDSCSVDLQSRCSAAAAFWDSKRSFQSRL